MLKKSSVIISVVAVALLVVLITTLSVLFAPRNLKNLVSVEDIESITLIDIDSGKEIQLNDGEIDDFCNQVKKAKYKPKYDLIKSVSVIKIQVNYSDGTSIVFDEYKHIKYNKDSKSEKVTPMLLSMKIFEDYKD